MLFIYFWRVVKLKVFTEMETPRVLTLCWSKLGGYDLEGNRVLRPVDSYGKLFLNGNHNFAIKMSSQICTHIYWCEFLRVLLALGPCLKNERPDNTKKSLNTSLNSPL